MKSQYVQNLPLTLRARSAPFYTGGAALIGLILLLTLAFYGGPAALARWGFWVLWGAYSIWYLLGRPALVIDRQELKVLNPGVSHRVNYRALVDVSTRFHLTLVTARRSYQAFALPASGMLASRSAHRAQLQSLPAISYGPGRSLRTSDLPNSAAGSAALLLRGYWQEQVEAGVLDSQEALEVSEPDWKGLGLFLGLGLLSLLSLFL
ncbi:MAG: PH domain-containing protein [Rothia sp. (in: high G+C Gram-positive bacteria)]|nr:PH domain-containing protein [Rothia sp. (in: high G+C Gram-positive bacteria)]